MTHVDDGDLVRWLDRTLGQLERAAVDGHVAGCGPCAMRLATVRDRSRRLSSLVALLDLPAPARPALRVAARAPAPSLAPPGWWRVAAVVALAAAGAAVPPVRAWIADTARAAWDLVTQPRRPIPAPPDSEPAGRIAFVPEGPVLTIRAPAGARIAVEAVASAQVSVAGSAGEAPPQVVVLPTELRFVAADSAPGHVVRVPAAVEVRIIIGDTEASWRPAAPGARRVFPSNP